jgi:hypothetical protein
VFNTRPRNLLIALQLLFMFVFPSAVHADALEDAVRALARRALPMAQAAKTVCVSWENHDAISDSRSLHLRSLFLAVLGIEQTSVGMDAGNCAIEVALNHTPTQLVLVAEIGVGEEKRVVISEIPRSETAGSAVTSSSVRLEKELLLQQREPILDALEIEGKNGETSSLLILASHGVSIFQLGTGGWKLKSSQSVARADGIQRAPRGELRLSAGSLEELQILFPGRICQMSMSQSGPVTCLSSSESWRAEVLPAPSCDGAAWGLRADSGDWSVPDRILLLNTLLPKTQTPLAGIGLPGPVLSLAPGSSPSVFAAVVFNLSTGNYEVYRVTLACGS